MLITCADSLGRNLSELHLLLGKHFRREDRGNVIGGVHILPFFPSSADRVFAPVRYDEVDSMINHISRRSPQFENSLRLKDRSPYSEMFIRSTDFWPGGRPTDEQVAHTYKRKPRTPAVEVTFANDSILRSGNCASLLRRAACR